MYGRIVQTAGVVAVLIGINIEIWQQQNIWSIIITAGSLIFALGTKMHYFSRIRKHKTQGG